MTDNVAVLQGYTRSVVATGGDYELYLMIQRDADLDGTFRAWDSECQEWVKVNGWLFTFEDVGQEEA